MADIEEWLRNLGLSDYIPLFLEHRIGLDILRDITDTDLQSLQVPIGDRKRILGAIAALRRSPDTPALLADPSQAAGRTPDPFGERRQLTVLFTDMVGSTRLSERLQLEDYQSILESYRQCCAAVVKAHAGYMFQYQGDGALCYFGYPHAAEDDAERAVLAALEIVRAVPAAPALRKESVRVRAAVASGVVLVGGLLSENESMAGHVSGEIPNLAARLQELAKSGEVLINAEAYTLLGRRFHCRDYGKHQLKGFSSVVPVWQVSGFTPGRSRFQGRKKRQRTLFVNRDDELDALHRNWLGVRSGQGQVVLVSGEPGIGKSRLTQEFTAQLSPAAPAVEHYQCLPNQSQRPFHPVIDRIESAAGLSRSVAADDKFKKLDVWIRSRFRTAPQRALAILAKLLDLPKPKPDDADDLAPREFRETLFRLVFDHLEAQCRREPTIIICEDLQWMDPTSQEFIERLIDRCADWSLLLICTSRPEYRASWVGNSNVTHITMRRLDERRCTAIIAEVSGGANLPAQVREEILTKTDGVPLFVEELTKSVIEAGVAQGREPSAAGAVSEAELLDAMPTTLLGSLLARLDRISGAKEVAPLGAAVGRSFSHEVIGRIVDVDESELQTILNSLVDAQLLTRRGVRPDVVYKFKHALVQDAAYSTMPKGKRRLVHRRIAAVLLDDAPARMSIHPEVLAYHHAKARDYTLARDQWCRAALLARERSANVEAVAYLNNALDANRHCADAAARRAAEIDLRLLLTVSLHASSPGSKATSDNLQRLDAIVGESGNGEALLCVRLGYFVEHIIRGEVAEARRWSERLVAIGDASVRQLTAILSARCFAVCDLMSARFEPAVAHFERVIELCERDFDPRIVDYHYANIVLTSQCMIAWARALAGDAAKTREALDKSLALSAAEPNEHSRAYAYCILSSAFQAAGRSEAALDYAQRAFELSKNRSYVYWEAWAQIMLGWAQAACGRPSEGIATLENGIEKYRRSGSRQMLPYAGALLADAYRMAGDRQRCAAVVDQLYGDGRSEVRHNRPLLDRLRRRG